MREWLQPHRVFLCLLGVARVIWCAATMRWDWLPKYAPMMVEGIWRTIWLLVLSSVLGMALAVPLGLAQAAGPLTADDTAETLAARILVEEHRLLPLAVARLLAGGWRLDGRRFVDAAG